MRDRDDCGHRAALRRQDLITFEQRLKDAVGALFPFKSHSIHFPRKLEDPSANWLAGEQKLLLPLPDGQGGFLGVFMARGVPEKKAPELSSHWPELGALIADNLLLYKRSLSDPVTGLFSRHYLLRSMEREIEALRDPIRTVPAPGVPTDPAAGSIARDAARGGGDGLLTGEGDSPSWRGLGTLVVRLAALRDVVREFGYQFADELMLALADALTALCPQQAIAARTGDSEFAVHLPAAGQRACRELAGKIAQSLRQVYVVHPLRREQVGIAASVGYTLYPQDMEGSLFVRSSAEQARHVLRKARLAAAMADEKLPMYPGRSDMPSVMGFGRILMEGGCVLESLPLSRVIVSLGSNMHAREGLRFSVWSSHFPAEKTGKSQPGTPLAPLYKGEIVLMEVREDVSQAEIIHLGEPAWNIEPGDHLLLLPEEQGSLARGRDGEARQDPETGLLRHGDFLARWSEELEKADAFALALIRLAPERNQQDDGAPYLNAGKESQDSGDRQTGEGGTEALFSDATLSDPSYSARFMTEAVRLCLEEFGSKTLGGRYGINSLIFYHPAADIAELSETYARLSRELEQRLGLGVAVGIAQHPYLEFRKADALENARKALEYAMLLPKPHVGLMDSLALNISADKRFSQGDTFGAIKEYQFALLADEKNGMAWNSLGICFAGLSRHAEAERHFTRALECNPQDAMALYNLGYMHQSQGRQEEAQARYRECLGIDPGHLYAMVRLGQIAENSGETKEARDFYEKAATLPGGASLTYRHFARLCVSEGKADEAREHLHEALLHDPQDPLSMALLAQLYLDGGEDPEMAATFARQSVSLRPDLKPGWLQLARALEAMGKTREAKEAKLKAGEI